MSTESPKFPEANILRMLQKGEAAITDGLAKNAKGKINLVFTGEDARSSELTVPDYQVAAEQALGKFHPEWKGRLRFDIFIQPEEEVGLTVSEDDLVITRDFVPSTAGPKTPKKLPKSKPVE